MLSIRNEEEVDALLLGLSFMGTGGGGTQEMGKTLLMDALNAGKEIKCITLDDLADEAQTACAYMMGSSSPVTDEKRQLMEAYGLKDVKVKNMQAAAIKVLEQFSNVKIDAIMPLELGAAATSGALSGAAWSGLPVIDADYMGRALPEISQTLPVIHELPLLPLASVDKYANEVIIKRASSYQMAERLGKGAPSASFDLAGQAAFLLKGHAVKSVSIPGTLTRAFELGKVIQCAQSEKTNVIDAIRTHLGDSATLLFEGVLTKVESYEEDGYFYGENHIEGRGAYSNQHYRVWFKNEHIQSWLDDTPDVSCPDLISIVDTTSGTSLLNGRMDIGQSVTIFGLPAHPKLKTERAIKLLGPHHFGFEFEYEPIDGDRS